MKHASIILLLGFIVISFVTTTMNIKKAKTIKWQEEYNVILEDSIDQLLGIIDTTFTPHQIGNKYIEFGESTDSVWYWVDNYLNAEGESFTLYKQDDPSLLEVDGVIHMGTKRIGQPVPKSFEWFITWLTTNYDKLPEDTLQ